MNSELMQIRLSKRNEEYIVTDKQRRTLDLVDELASKGTYDARDIDFRIARDGDLWVRTKPDSWYPIDQEGSLGETVYRKPNELTVEWPEGKDYKKQMLRSLAERLGSGSAFCEECGSIVGPLHRKH